jgi:TonB family protein
MNKTLFLRAWLVLTLLPLSCIATSPFQPNPTDADAGVSIEQVGVLVFPPSMIYSGISTGEVHTAISVDQNGKLVDYLLVSYTEKAFADAALAALKRWRYQAARVHGRPQSSRADVIFSFRDQGVVVQSLPGAAERRIVEEMLNGRFIYRACQLRDLDRIPTPVHVVSPVFSGDTRKRSVTVGFYIDEEGKVRLPSVSRDAADDFFAAAAVQAVEQWRFEPPLRKGFPVLVYAEQEFNFTPKQ